MVSMIGSNALFGEVEQTSEVPEGSITQCGQNMIICSTAGPKALFDDVSIGTFFLMDTSRWHHHHREHHHHNTHFHHDLICLKILWKACVEDVSSETVVWGNRAITQRSILFNAKTLKHLACFRKPVRRYCARMSRAKRCCY